MGDLGGLSHPTPYGAIVASVPFGGIDGDGSIEAYRIIVGEGRVRNNVRCGCYEVGVP